jgi:hypothetical protein
MVENQLRSAFDISAYIPIGTEGSQFSMRLFLWSNSESRLKKIVKHPRFLKLSLNQSLCPMTYLPTCRQPT